MLVQFQFCWEKIQGSIIFRRLVVLWLSTLFFCLKFLMQREGNNMTKQWIMVIWACAFKQQNPLFSPKEQVSHCLKNYLPTLIFLPDLVFLRRMKPCRCGAEKVDEDSQLKMAFGLLVGVNDES